MACCVFFSTITTFGTAFDITLDELRSEALHPADAQTERAVRSGQWLTPTHGRGTS